MFLTILSNNLGFLVLIKRILLDLSLGFVISSKYRGHKIMKSFEIFKWHLKSSIRKIAYKLRSELLNYLRVGS